MTLMFHARPSTYSSAHFSTADGPYPPVRAAVTKALDT